LHRIDRTVGSWTEWNAWSSLLYSRTRSLASRLKLFGKMVGKCMWHDVCSSVRCVCKAITSSLRVRKIPSTDKSSP
jgi:hypothetical protein